MLHLGPPGPAAGGGLRLAIRWRPCATGRPSIRQARMNPRYLRTFNRSQTVSQHGSAIAIEPEHRRRETANFVPRKPPTAPISVIVPVKNEADNLRRCLPALSWADQVFVVDSQSTDATIEVARAHGARVAQFHFNGSFPK